MLRSWTPFFIFWPTYFIPKTFLAIQPLICHLPPSHAVPRSTMYPSGLPHHPSSPLAIHPSIVLRHRQPLRKVPSNPLSAPIGNSIVLSLLFSIFSSDIITAHTSLLRKSHHSIVLPIRIGTSHLYIRATISLELGLKPNLVFNPRLVASLSLS